MRIGFVEWPDGLIPFGPAWDGIALEIRAKKPDLLITNELPFGIWIASRDQFDAITAEQSVSIHERGIGALSELEVPAILTSRPVNEGSKLANEAILIEGARIRPIHRKQYFPDEQGWRESEWYATADRGFGSVTFRDANVGVLLCTELMFNEHARFLGRSGVDVIAVPRATGRNNRNWHIAGAMAALVGGCYVISSNRSGQASEGGPSFGGEGFAYAPGGELVATTTPEQRLTIVELDLAKCRGAQQSYPCYVEELR